MRNTLTFFSLMTLTALVLAQPGAQPGPGMTFGSIRRCEPAKGMALVTRSFPRIVEVPITETVIVDGQQRNIIRLVRKTEYIETDIYYDIANARVITAEGKQLPIDAVWKAFTPGTIVAISGDINTPSASYLKALNKKTLVLIPAPLKAEPIPKKEKS